MLCTTTAFFEFIERGELRASCLFSETLRYLTVAILDLSHTCCGWSNYHEVIMKFNDEGDIQKIQDEEEDICEKLEGLLSGFEKKKTELAISTSEFLSMILENAHEGRVERTGCFDQRTTRAPRG